MKRPTCTNRVWILHSKQYPSTASRHIKAKHILTITKGNQRTWYCSLVGNTFVGKIY